MKKTTVAYYPGCSAVGTSVEYEKSTRAVCNALGIQLEEVQDWSCCGSSPAHTVNHILSAALSGRNLALAGSMGHSTVATPCPSCLINLRTSARKLEDPEFGTKVNALLDDPCDTPVEPKSVLQVIVEDYGVEEVARLIRKPLKGLKVACYYGCIMTRPPELMRFDDPENPMAMDQLMEVAGAEVLPFPLKVECCGASSGIPRKDIVMRLSGKLLQAAEACGADAVVSACPLCQMNLDLRQKQIRKEGFITKPLPIFYFTQLLGLAIGVDKRTLRFDKLVVSPKRCLEKVSG